MTPQQFTNVTVPAKANIYFDGKVLSHTLIFGDGTTKTLGIIFAGEFHFGTKAAERMEITSGSCTVKLDGTSTSKNFAAGEFFDVPANSGFTISVSGICEYICSYIR